MEGDEFAERVGGVDGFGWEWVGVDGCDRDSSEDCEVHGCADGEAHSAEGGGVDGIVVDDSCDGCCDDAREHDREEDVDVSREFEEEEDACERGVC